MAGFDDLWTRYMGAGVTPEAYAAEGWDMARILQELRGRGLTGAELADVANDIAAGLEARGLGPTAPAAEIDSITLTTHHGAPVAVINGLAYGPADMTPAGVIGSELVGQWAARFAGQGQPDRAADGREIERLRGIVADYRREMGIRTKRARDAVTQLRVACLAARDRLQATSFDGVPMTGDVVFDQLTKALEDTGGFDPEAQP